MISKTDILIIHDNTLKNSCMTHILQLLMEYKADYVIDSRRAMIETGGLIIIFKSVLLESDPILEPDYCIDISKDSGTKSKIAKVNRCVRPQIGFINTDELDRIVHECC